MNPELGVRSGLGLRTRTNDREECARASPRLGCVKISKAGRLLAVLASWTLAELLLVGSFGEALAVKASPPTVYCSPSKCEVCIELEHTESGDRCVKCKITSTEYCLDKSGGEWTPPGKPHVATVKKEDVDGIDVYDKPVEPRKVIGIMGPGSSAPILDYHPDGWCKLGDITAFLAGGRSEGWIAQDHLEGCP
jgi:hypothetical protein